MDFVPAAGSSLRENISFKASARFRLYPRLGLRA